MRIQYSTIGENSFLNLSNPRVGEEFTFKGEKMGEVIAVDPATVTLWVYEENSSSKILDFIRHMGRSVRYITLMVDEKPKVHPSCYGIKRETIERWIGQLMTASVYGEFDPVSRDHVERIISELEIIIS